MDIEDIPIGSSTVILGIGNIDRGDDGVGAYIAEELISKGRENVFNCGEVPENYITKVCGLAPAIAIFIDAVQLGKDPGTVEFLDIEECTQGLTTHNASLCMVAEFLRSSCGSEIIFIGIQPGTLSGGMSEKVREAADMIIKVMNGC
ncbi:MAG: hydrogenase 3 maturation endopeptidase HyCI [Elusimicrobia bacterium]|nr:hydrogenase 3 maturation endopeptidase HyCI [Elusimicrobiota bacterium]